MKPTADQIIELLNAQLKSAEDDPNPPITDRVEVIDDLITKIYEQEEMLAILSHSSPIMHPYMD